MRTGKKKVLIGSTDKCGTGVNVQTHLVAIHHVDCPWKPSSIDVYKRQTWLIIFLVVDLILVVIGSQLWKHANHLAPAAKENKLAYWVQTDLGVIVAAIAFAPVILLMLTNKDLDKGTKKVLSLIHIW